MSIQLLCPWILGIKRVSHSRQGVRNPLEKELGAHGNGVDWGGYKEAYGMKENSPHFWSNLIVKTGFAGIINEDILKKQLPTFPRPQKVS